MDFSPENLPNLKSTIEKAYPDVKVRLHDVSIDLAHKLTRYTQATVIEADAANEAAIEGVCKQALKEEGKLDVFYANVRAFRYLSHLTTRGC